MAVARIHIRGEGYARPGMSLYQWLLALHVTGAFFVIGGSVIAATLAVFAQRR